MYDLQTNDSCKYTCTASGPHVTTGSQHSKDIKVINVKVFNLFFSILFIEKRFYNKETIPYMRISLLAESISFLL